MSEFKTTIGLEIHVQLKTKSKMFCSCDNDAENAPANSLVCPVCLGMPGVLPVTNYEAVRRTLKVGLALGAKINSESKFDRKHYFYPDLPKGFQISQYDKPFCLGGEVEIEGRKIRLNRIHLEEDAGKLLHPVGKNYSLVDLNRAGTPLMEIVTEPDITSPAEARKFMEESQLVLRYLQVSDANMEKGHLRCDANISVSRKSKVESRKSVEKMSSIVEIKNLNSFKFVEQALAFEEKRLRDDYAKWPKEVEKITRGFNSSKGITFEQRRKEEAADYRYFPEPDIPPISFSKSELEKIKNEITEMPKMKKERYIKSGVRPDVAERIIRIPYIAEYLESSGKLKKDLAVFVSEEVNRAIENQKITFKEYRKRVPITAIADLLNLVGTGIISKTVAKEIFSEMVRSGKKAAEIIRDKGLEQVSDRGELDAAISEVLRENLDLVKKYQEGKTQVVGFFVGQIMRKTAGRANPQVLNKLLKEKLDGNNK